MTAAVCRSRIHRPSARERNALLKPTYLAFRRRSLTARMPRELGRSDLFPRYVDVGEMQQALFNVAYAVGLH